MRHDIHFLGGSPEFLIVGLGNPGARYTDTRHNVGFMALDYIASERNAEVKRLRHSALTGKCYIDGISVLLIKPQTYMNNSGLSVVDAARYYNIPAQNIIVCYDDTALPVGALRIRESGSAGGHNGMKSIIEHLGTDDFQRIRFGIGKKPEGWDLADYVLGILPPEDKSAISENFKNLLPAIDLMMHNETDMAMSRYNRPGKTDK